MMNDAQFATVLQELCNILIEIDKHSARTDFDSMTAVHYLRLEEQSCYIEMTLLANRDLGFL